MFGSDPPRRIEQVHRGGIKGRRERTNDIQTAPLLHFSDLLSSLLRGGLCGGRLLRRHGDGRVLLRCRIRRGAQHHTEWSRVVRVGTLPTTSANAFRRPPCCAPLGGTQRHQRRKAPRLAF